MRTVRLLLTLAVLHGTIPRLLAASVADYAVQVSATVQTNPPLITLSWPPDPAATNYSLFRKGRDDTSWGTATALAASATGWVDSNVVKGAAYEYRIAKTGPGYFGYGYIYAGIEVPLVESRGKAILLVDNTHVASLAMELSRLQQDLVGDGWTVVRHDVARSDSVTNIKSLITADYNADPANAKAVFIFGHVPVPYSGVFAPDGHANHQGAWPADVYYGDMNGVWTDSSVNTTLAQDPRNWNLRGDGKFDQIALPSDVDLEVGRVDLANLPAFGQSEGELLRQYLNKDHNFRHKLITAGRRGLIDDNFGVNNGEVFVRDAWRNFAPLFAASNTFERDWFTTLAAQSYLWGYGCGSGTYTSASGVGTTSQFAASDPRVVFTMLFGSYFGDWDSQDNFLRAPLATPTYTLACAWAGRPNWQFHHMALGETIGFSTRVTQNNSVGYDPGGNWRFVHIALMGDPTLRLHPVAPASLLVVNTNGFGGADLSWNPSPDTVAGYHVYRAPTVAGPFTRLNGMLITGTNYTDPVVSSDVYMVRAVKLEVSGSGSYYNASQGIFQNLTGTVGAPSVGLVKPANNATFDPMANIPIIASVFDPSNSITRVEYYANGLKIGEATALSYSLTWSNVPPTNYSLTVSAFSGVTPVANSGLVAIRVGSVAPKLTIAPLGNGSYGIGGTGFPGYTYRVQFADDLQVTNWQTLGPVTANSIGGFQFTNSNDATQRFYRSVYP